MTGLEDALMEVRSSILADTQLHRAVAAGRRHGLAPPRWRRLELRWIDVAAGRRLSVTRYDATQAFTTNLTAEQAPSAIDELLAEPYGNWHVERLADTVALRVTKKGRPLLHRSVRSADTRSTAHDRAKKHLLPLEHPVLRAVGLTDEHGRVKAARHNKHRQAEQFLRALEPVLPAAVAAAGDGPLRVVDLGCGNAYLTLVAYAWLTGEHGLEVRMVGVDVKAQARQHNTDLVAELGWSEQVSFIEGGIADADIGMRPHLALALHACDTATDDALVRGIDWGCDVIVAAPCCHHDLQRQLRASVPPPGYSLLMRHGILAERLADVLTDALRAAVLRRRGYRVDVLEFVESAHTPRNVLLRAVRSSATASAEVDAEFAALTSHWKVQPALERRLSGDRSLAVRRSVADRSGDAVTKPVT